MRTAGLAWIAYTTVTIESDAACTRVHSIFTDAWITFSAVAKKTRVAGTDHCVKGAALSARSAILESANQVANLTGAAGQPIPIKAYIAGARDIAQATARTRPNRGG